MYTKCKTYTSLTLFFHHQPSFCYTFFIHIFFIHQVESGAIYDLGGAQTILGTTFVIEKSSKIPVPPIAGDVLQLSLGRPATPNDPRRPRGQIASDLELILKQFL